MLISQLKNNILDQMSIIQDYQKAPFSPDERDTYLDSKDDIYRALQQSLLAIQTLERELSNIGQGKAS